MSHEPSALIRRLIAVGITALAVGLDSVSPAGSATTVSGLLAGQTQISFGCPGPVREGAPSWCHPWRSFAHARFDVAARAADGTAIVGTSRLVVSDGLGGFALRLPVGSYIVSPLAQAHTHGGEPITVRVSAANTTVIRVRFQGFPMMV